MLLKNIDTAMRLSHAVTERMLVLPTLSDFTISILFPLQAYCINGILCYTTFGDLNFPLSMIPRFIQVLCDKCIAK